MSRSFSIIRNIINLKSLTFQPKMFMKPYDTVRRCFTTKLKAFVPEYYTNAEQEIVDSIKMLIEKRIRPIVQQDGGNVDFISFDPNTGFVYVRLSGACVGCAQSDVTLKHMIQGMLCHYIDEITAVYNCNDEGFIISDNNHS